MRGCLDGFGVLPTLQQLTTRCSETKNECRHEEEDRRCPKGALGEKQRQAGTRASAVQGQTQDECSGQSQAGSNREGAVEEGQGQWEETAVVAANSMGSVAMKHKLVTAVVGSYRKGGVIDTTVEEILASARSEGAQTEKIFLPDKHIEFCTNCRACTQIEGTSRGKCCLEDDMGAILDTLERSDAIVLASSMNFYTVTAIMKRFIERLVCYGYWPWGSAAPEVRNLALTRRAVLVGSSAAPAIIARRTTGLVGLLKRSARLLGAKTVGVLFIGCAASQPEPKIGARTRLRAMSLGRKLVSVERPASEANLG